MQTRARRGTVPTFRTTSKSRHVGVTWPLVQRNLHRAWAKDQRLNVR